VQQADGDDAAANQLAELNQSLLATVGQAIVVGLRRTDASTARDWQQLARQSEQLGMQRLGKAIGRVGAGLLRKADTATWDWQPTAEGLLALAVLARLAQDTSG
jgi:hypothetical protein